jgi:hypothetical protein
MRWVKVCFAVAFGIGLLGSSAGCEGVRRRAVPVTGSVQITAASTTPATSQPATTQPNVVVRPKPTTPKTERPLVVDARTFAQELYDDTSGKAVGRYANKTLEVEGTIAACERWDGGAIKDAQDPIGIIDFVVPVTDSRKGGPKEYKIKCKFKQPVMPEDPKFAGLAKGKPVTIHGRLADALAGQPDATLRECVVVR